MLGLFLKFKWNFTLVFFIWLCFGDLALSDGGLHDASNGDKVPSNRTLNNPRSPRLCKNKHADGNTEELYGPCVDKVATDKPKPTDTEVDGLKQRPYLTSTTEKSSQHSPQKVDEAQFAVDRLVQPESRLHTNSRFDVTTGGIVALLSLIVAIFFFAGIILGKRILMNGYQNREILLNDDDIGDVNDEDMRHFELKFLDKDGRAIESPIRK